MGAKVLIKDVTGVGGYYMTHSDMPCVPYPYTAKAGRALEFFPVAGTDIFTSRPAWLDGKPNIGFICGGPWMPIEADAFRDATAEEEVVIMGGYKGPGPTPDTYENNKGVVCSYKLRQQLLG